MRKTEVKLMAVVGASAVATLGVLGMAVGQERAGAGSVASSGMSTGVTVTATNPPTEPANAIAVPAIKGPAPLPTEEQGLPG
jgi:hypothetical protein